MGSFTGFVVGLVAGAALIANFDEISLFAKQQMDEIRANNATGATLDDSGDYSKAEYATVKKASTPHNGIVAIDVGHGKEKFGAVSARGYTEFSYNLNIANKLSKELSERGFKPILINAEGSDMGVKERPAIASQKNARIFVSIHHDSANESDIKPWTFEGRKLDYTTANSGYSIFVDKDNADSLNLAASIGRGFNGNGLTPTSYHADNHPMINKERGVYHRPSLGVLKAATIPAVLVECGVIKNKDDEEVLMSAEGQSVIVDSIADGIESAMKGVK